MSNDASDGRLTPRRRRVRRRTAVIAVAAVTAIVLAGCSSAAKSSGGGGSGAVTLATLFPLSGPNATFGQGNLQGVEVGLDAVKQGIGGIKGVDLNLASLDSQALPSPAVQAMNQAVHVRKAPFVLTAFSAVTKAIAPIANQTKTVLMQGGASSPDLAKLGSYVFNDVPLADLQTPAVIDYAIKQKNLKKWAVIYSDEPLGQTLSANLAKTVPAAGGQILSTTGVAVDQTEFSSVVAKVRQDHPDVVYLATSFGGMTELIDQLRQGGVKSQLITFAGTDSPEVIALKNSEGMLLTGQSIDYVNTDAYTKFFNTDFKKRYPKATPNTVTVNYANAVIIAAKAIAYLHSKKEAVTGENIATAIHTLKDFDVIGGTVSFQPNGTVETSINVLEITGGVEKSLKTYPVSALK
jgi:branched-chain amino acid transport system substrate-binding protein